MHDDAMSTDTKTVADLDLNDEHITAGVSDTLQEAARRLLTVPGGILIVLDDNSKVKGVIGYKQLLVAIDKEIDTKTATCGEHMEMDFMQVELKDSLKSVLADIQTRSPQAVVAVDENQEFVGYFSPGDYREAVQLVDNLKGLNL